MKVHELVNNIADFNSPILLQYYDDNGEAKTLSKDLNRKILLNFFGEKEIFSIGATNIDNTNYIVLNLALSFS